MAYGANPIEARVPPERLGPYQIVVDASATGAGLRCALRSTAIGGHCTSTGIYFEEQPIPLYEMYLSCVTYHAGPCQARPLLPAVLELIATGRFDPQPVSQSIAGLQLEATYHYRLVATSSKGTIYGEDHTFTSRLWSMHRVPESGQGEERLLGVSCVSSTYCVGVGRYYEAGYNWPLAATWNGTEWSIHNPPRESGELTGELNGVSCTSETACTAVGVYATDASGGEDVTLAERWNGKAWTIQSTPNPEGKEGRLRSYLTAVSCISATECMAVGWDGISGVAEHWNNESGWSLQTTASVENTGIIFSGVSCSSASACTAAGSYRDSSAEIMLIEHWNGKEWSVQVDSAPAGTEESTLNGVSCTSSGECTAVGNACRSATGYSKECGAPDPLHAEPYILSDHWNNKAWSVQTVPSPAGTDGVLYGVSCRSSTACAAVGTASTAELGQSLPLAERWNGAEWAIQSTPEPGGASITRLEGVSCVSAEACVATGEYYDRRRFDAIAESYLGPPPPTATTEAVSGLTQEGKTATLNGTVNPEGDDTHYHFEYGKTTSYGTNVPVPSADVGYGTSNVKVTNSVSALTPSTTYHVRLVAANADGTTYGSDQMFTTMGPPLATTQPATSVTSTGAILNGIVNPEGVETTYHFEYGKTTSYGTSVPVPSANVGSGTSSLEESKAVMSLEPETTYHFRLVATNADGTTEGSDRTFTTLGWSLQSSPDPTGATESYLAGAPYAGGTHVSCSSSTACTGVGFYTNSSGTPSTLAERWNGTEWSIQSTPNPSGAKESYLHGVSCSSSTACTAVGHYKNSAGVYVTLAERWNGTEWIIQSTPNPSEAKEAFLEDVSCSSSTTCTAVGFYVSGKDVPSTLAEQWNGTEWSVQSTPNPTGATQSEFRGMSCSSSTACTAVGWYKSGSGYAALAERWNGTEWSIQSVAKPTGATYSWFGGVSCSLSTACTAVGEYINSSGADVTLAERWNGTEWAVQSTPNPSGATTNVLVGISCSSSTACIAVGYDKNSSGTYVTLAERWNGTEWLLQLTPNPTGATESELSGVSCSSSILCTAVGYDKNSSGTPVTLAEIYG